MAPLSITMQTARYHALIGVGGIGSGMFFALNGSHTLGREESRSGHFLDRRDYCKLHIIAHYVKTLLGPEFHTIPVGKVGGDDTGHHLIAHMQATGMDMRYVQTCPDAPTLVGICLIYPDGSGGNLTPDNSACTKVDPAFVAQAEPEFAAFQGQGIALAAPEVSLAAREKLLELGTTYGFLRVASFVSGEIDAALTAGLLAKIDLLALNLDEAAMAAGIPVQDQPPASIVQIVVDQIRARYPHLLLSITAGKQGSWIWDRTSLGYAPALDVPVVNTAGAGDAHIAGLIAGLTAGLSLSEAHQLAVLVAALSVTSPHTICEEIDRYSLQTLSTRSCLSLSAGVRTLLQAYI